MIINLTQHTATPDQLAAGVVDLPADVRVTAIKLLTFDDIPDGDDIERRAAALAIIARDHVEMPEDEYAPMPRAMIGGAPWLMHALEEALIDAGVWPVYAFSRRVVVESTAADGTVTKTAQFRHDGFVRASRP